MSDINPVVKDELLKLLAHKREERQQLQEHLSNLGGDIEAIERTLRLCGNGRVAMPHSVASISPQALKGLTHLEALKTIAKTSNGIVKLVEAKKLFLDAGVTTAKSKNIAPHLYNLLKESGYFEWIAPGIFRLLEGQPSLFKDQQK